MHARCAMSISLMLLVGCAPKPQPSAANTQGPEDTTGAIVQAKVGDPTPASPQHYDFGTVLAQNQTLSHDFSLFNESSEVLKVHGISVDIPCCSSVVSAPSRVAPHSSALVKTALKVARLAQNVWALQFIQIV